MHKCSKCGEEKVEFCFKLKGGGRAGYHSWCKVCINARRRALRLEKGGGCIGRVSKYASEEERKAAAKISRQKSKAKKREIARFEREAAGIFLSNKKLTPEERLAKNRQKAARRRERDIAAGKIIPRVILTPEERLERRRAVSRRMKKNPAARAAKSVYRRNRKAKQRNAVGRHTKQDIERIHTAQKYKCAICKCSTKDKCEVDHIMPLALGGSNDPLNLQILCPACNNRKNAKHPVDYMQSLGLLL
jgi:5-methylcytosine-specific restriction endonuclease McrA